jgi:predicted DNA-binding transcriptional regulator AlpA
MEFKLIPSTTVREICGGISDMSLWRWLNDPAMNFPRPLVISRRRYWRETDIAKWIAERERAAA